MYTDNMWKNLYIECMNTLKSEYENVLGGLSGTQMGSFGLTSLIVKFHFSVHGFKIASLGHSMGSTSILVMGSLRPEVSGYTLIH
jgi:hypothetical protein